jgi:hypothetical protein
LQVLREQKVTGKILVIMSSDAMVTQLRIKPQAAHMLTARVARVLMDLVAASGCPTCRKLVTSTPSVVQHVLMPGGLVPGGVY